MYYGKISTDIGYIYIGPDLIGDDNTWSEAIDKIIDILKDTKGIIVDIRNNGGGSDNLGIDVASRFANQQRTFAYLDSELWASIILPLRHILHLPSHRRNKSVYKSCGIINKPPLFQQR